VTAEACPGQQPSGYIARGGDCNDASAAVNPGAAETCNGIDDNCSGQADENLPLFTYYIDADRDGVGSSVTVQRCNTSAPDGYATVSGDNCPDTYNPSQADCDGDGIGNVCEAGDADCNSNGTSDLCEIYANPALDINGDGVLDSCTGAMLVLRTTGPEARAPGSIVDVDAVALNLPVNAVGLQLYVQWDITELEYVSASAGTAGFLQLGPPTVETVTGSPNLRRLRMLTGQDPFTGGSGVPGGVLASIRFTVAASASICVPKSVLSFAPPSATVQNGTTITGLKGAIAHMPVPRVIIGTDTVAPTLTGVPASVTSTSGQADSGDLAAFVAAANAVTAVDSCSGAAVLRTVTLPGGTVQQSLPTVFPEGVTTVTWTARDLSGNQSAPQSRTVTINACSGTVITFYPDGDADGFGRDTGTTQACSTSTQPGFSAVGGDCDDANAQVNPGAAETCNGLDDNCNSQVDEGVRTIFYRNIDGDAFGDTYATQQACSAPSGYVSTPGDCDDTQPTTFPGAPEVCDGRDNDCDLSVDEGLQSYTYYPDADRDGYGSGASIQLCSVPAPDGYSTASGDNCPDTYNPSQADCDGNGTGDACVIASDPDAYDCDSSGVPDGCELAADPDLDIDGNGIIDTCQGPTLKLTTASSVVEPDTYFFVDLSETRFDERIMSGSFRLAYNASLIEHIEVVSTVHYTATLVSDTVQGSTGELRFTVAATGVVGTTPEVILARILVKAIGGPLCVPTSIMHFVGGTAENTVTGTAGTIPGDQYDLYEKAIMAFDATAPVLAGVPGHIYAYAGNRNSMAIPPYANADVYAFDTCGDGADVDVDLRITLPNGAEVHAMPAEFPLGMSVVRWRAVDLAGNVAREIRIVEVVAGPPPPCSGDIIRDGDSEDVIDGEDLAAVLGTWGRTGVPADINGDGIVDSVDLTYLLSAWGPCP
jgi:hypothetical protein